MHKKELQTYSHKNLGISTRILKFRGFPKRIGIVVLLLLLSFGYFIWDTASFVWQEPESDFVSISLYNGVGEANDGYEHPVDIESVTSIDYADNERKFVMQTNKSIYEFKNRMHIISLEHSDEDEIKPLLNELSVAFIDNIIRDMDIPSHVLAFYSNPDFVYQALLIQHQYGIPASVTLANAADESGYGRSELSKYGKNFFGLKSKKGYSGPTCHITTPEEFTESEYNSAKKSGIHMELKTTKWSNGRKIYVVTIKDYFRKYASYKESFNDFAKFLRNEDRYARIFQKGGGNWIEWCAMFKPKRDGGIPYATSSSKSRRLKDIIERYRLYLLDVN